MIISDLNHLEVVAENQIQGGNHLQLDYVNGAITYVSLTAGLALNNVAVGSANAGAIGWNTFTKADSSTFTTPISSNSTSYTVSVSAP